jgi:hypothetical protein
LSSKQRLIISEKTTKEKSDEGDTQSTLHTQRFADHDTGQPVSNESFWAGLPTRQNVANSRGQSGTQRSRDVVFSHERAAGKNGRNDFGVRRQPDEGKISPTQKRK